MALPNIKNLFGNIFEDEVYSDAHFSKYINKVIELKSASNIGGRFNISISEMAPKILAWDTSMGLEATDLVHQLTGTIGENMAYKTDLDFIRIKDSYLRTKLVDKPLVYADFMPRGMGEYTHADKHQLPVLLERYRDFAIAHVADLDVAFKNDCIAMVTASELAHTNHANTVAIHSGDATNSEALRTIVELQGMDDLRYTGKIFHGDIDTCLSFHPFHLLQSVPQHPHTKLAGILAVGEVKFLINGAWAANVHVRVTALTGDAVGGSISVAIVDHENDPMPITAKKIKNPKTNSFAASALQTSPAATCLIVKSNNLTGPSSYLVEIYIVND